MILNILRISEFCRIDLLLLIFSFSISVFFCPLLVTENWTLRGSFLYLKGFLNIFALKLCIIINNFRTGVHTTRCFSVFLATCLDFAHHIAIWYFPSRAVSILLSIYYTRTVSQKLICFSDRFNYRTSPVPLIDNICGHIISLCYVCFFFLPEKNWSEFYGCNIIKFFRPFRNKRPTNVVVTRMSASKDAVCTAAVHSVESEGTAM
jgi:hypothetical protein